MNFCRYVWLLAGLCLIGPGCAQSGSLRSKGTNVGTLKTSLSHMEFENQQLRKEVANLKSEIRQTEDRLVQEESNNGELSARLDNAKAMLKSRGLEASELAESSPVDHAPEPSRITLPAGRSTRKPRKPPSAQIPGRIEALPSTDDLESRSNGWGRPVSDAAEDDPALLGRRDGPAVWLPVARGVSDSTIRR